MKSKRWLYKLLGEMIDFAGKGDMEEFYLINEVYGIRAKRGGYSEVLTRVDSLYETCRMNCVLSLSQNRNSGALRDGSLERAKRLYEEIRKLPR